MSRAGKPSFLAQRRRELVRAAKRILREPTPEDFHATRVAARRLRAALGVLEESQHEKAHERAIVLRRLGRRLGRVRDLDVVLARVKAFSSAQAAEASRGLAAFAKEARSKRTRARRRAARMLESKEFDELGRKLRTLSYRLEDSGETVAELSRSLVLSRGRRLLAVDIDPRTAGSEDLHRYRVRIKRFRYVLELSASETNLSTLLLDQARRAQDQLGVLNDAFVAEARVKVFLAESPRHRGSVALARLAAACRDDQARARADLPAVTTSFRAALAAFLAEQEGLAERVGPGVRAVRSPRPSSQARAARR
jgi:CHAD domain-containing protein